MTSDKQSNPILAGFFMLLFLITIIIGFSVFSIEEVASQSQPTIEIDDKSIQAGESGTTDIVLSDVPNGLSGYKLSVHLENGKIANFTDATYPSSFSLTEDPIIKEGGNRIDLKAADLQGNIQSGDGPVTLATLEIRGESGGSSNISIEIQQIDNDSGGAINVSVAPGEVSVPESGRQTTTATESQGNETETGTQDGENSPAPTTTTLTTNETTTSDFTSSKTNKTEANTHTKTTTDSSKPTSNTSPANTSTATTENTTKQTTEVTSPGFHPIFPLVGLLGSFSLLLWRKISSY